MHRTSLAIAIGDPNGIGPEIAVKAALALAGADGPSVALCGDPSVIEHYAKCHAPGIPLRMLGADWPAPAAAIDVVPVVGLANAAFQPGQVSAAAGAATLAYARAAIELVRGGRAVAVVACPHSEQSVNAAGIPFTGYPAFLAECCGIAPDRVFLMLVGAGLRIVHATLHERLANALGRLTPELVEAAGLAAAAALKTMGIEAPRIGIFGINPHASEEGLFGNDDEAITRPAAARLRRAGIDTVGPLGADLLLARRELDAYIAMYHDQGHIPVKLLAGRESAAFSIGTGVAFSSVGHGSAFDIAGRGMADPSALLRTLRLIGACRSGTAETTS